MKKRPVLAGLALTIGVGAVSFAHAATVQPYQQPAFEAAQKSGAPILVFVEASWCPTCAKERPILQQLYATAEFAKFEPLTAAALQKILARHTTARFGHSVNTHLFRDCAATSVASDDPEHVRICAQLLGHGSFKTTERHYIVANMRSASDRYHDIIESIRADARQHRSPP